MINGYQYRPHMSIPQALASFLEGQGRTIEQAHPIDIFFCGEGLDTFSARMEGDLARRCKTSLHDMRRFRVEFPDGYVYEGYLAVLDQDNWYICAVSLLYRVKE